MPGTSLIGRERELADVAERMRDHRLVTLVGPGGVGKTALAKAIGDTAGERFPLGVRFIDLTRIDDEQAVPGAVASQLGYDSFEAMIASPADHPVLLVVDNCEHVLDTAAQTLTEVLGSCQQPTILATSRSPLEVAGESVASVAPLPPPDIGDPRSNASVRLFLARARDAGATIDDGDLDDVAELCRRLDGLPLALEIAAARSRTTSVADINRRLETSVDVLTRPRYRGAPRHRSVADTISWSYELLPTSAARLLDRLGVCHGTFTADVAHALSPPVTTAATADDVDGDLEELVHASLVVVDTTSNPTRYRLLDTVRRFAVERLRQRGDLDATIDRLVDHVVSSTRAIVAGSTTTWRRGLMHELHASYDDIAGALRMCNERDRDPRRAYALCSVLWGVVHQGRADDIVRIARDTLARWPTDGSLARAQSVATLATAEYVNGDPERGLELARTALADLDRPGLPAVTLRRAIGQASAALGRFDEAIAVFREGAEIGRQLGMDAMAIELDITGSIVVADNGDVDGALERLAQAADEARRQGSVLSATWATTSCAWVSLRRDRDSAMALATRALDDARRLDFPVAVAVGMRTLAYGHLLAGDVAGARREVSALFDDLQARGALSNIRLLVDPAAALARAAGHPAHGLLTATAEALPITTLACGRFQLTPTVDPPVVAPLGRRSAMVAVRDLLAELGDSDAAATTGTTTSDAVATNVFREQAGLVEICYRGRGMTIRASKGLSDLRQLLAEPGREIHCLDLAGAGVEETSTGPVVDTTARRQYEQRIRDLQDDIDEAEHNQDFGRSYRAQVELDTLIDHLTSIVGLAGKDRRGAGTAERARSAVTHRVRAAIRQIDKSHAELGRHLANSITTGTWFAYRPEAPTTWTTATSDPG